MRILVLGGGVIGVTTAWYLAADGHEVTVVERADAVARETSFQNGGLVAAGHAVAWVSPAAPMELLRSVFERDPPIRPALRLEPSFWLWGLAFLSRCTTAGHRAETARILRVARYSFDLLRTLRESEGIDYAQSSRGILYVFRTERGLASGLGKWAQLREAGLELEPADRTRCAGIEPALAADAVSGGMYCPGDEGGDPHLFTAALAGRCEARGVTFRLGTAIRGFRTEQGRIAGVSTDRGELSADAYVLALGSHAPGIARTAGLHLPILPIKGYTLCAPVADPERAPRTGVIDEESLVSFSRLGERLRVGGKAEFAGHDTSFAPENFRGHLRAAEALFPGAADYGRARHWACLRPVTPGGAPILGATRFPNLFLNAGHGMLGWTMACGAARIVADQVAGRTPDIDLEGMAAADL